jgi:hypothetical protein
MKTHFAIGILAATVLLLAALYFAFKPSTATPDNASPQSETFRLAISTRTPTSESTVYTARQGDRVTLVVTTDRPGSINLHGYEQEIALTPGDAVTMSFIAQHAGRYPLHLHGSDGSHLEVGALEVLPR